MKKSAVGRVEVVQIGDVQVRRNNVVGTGAPMLWWTFTARDWTEPLPVNIVAIEHRKGWVLWDTGQAPAVAADSRAYFPGGLVGAVYARQIKAGMPAGHTLIERLDAADVSLEDVVLGAISHLHYDHAGNVDVLADRDIPVLVDARELALLHDKKPEMHGVLARHLLAAAPSWQGVTFTPSTDPALSMFEGAHDIFGDGTLVLVPTPGHSAGSMSLVVRRGPGRNPLILVGDALYSPEAVDTGNVPDVGNRAAQKDTLTRIAAARDAMPGLQIIASHDPLAHTLIS